MQSYTFELICFNTFPFFILSLDVTKDLNRAAK